ncbi:hypothetical protein QNH18_16975 [Bacillus paralicheniformis]|uniref:hypothetical protein n=1 Tax=Bacillus paralicheniformis TaxID=1648923 RepID=UPI0024C1C3CB|nr:hypothetical protein [Bacillus paralicheniformis]WHX85841.1 hypothetical protein QNH18_16975 [Bacillus paralicheniformis]
MTKTKKYVRILKAKYESSWYADKIGEVFELTGDTGPFYDVSVPGGVRLVKVEDAELIVTEKRPAKVGERVLITDKYGTSGEYKNGDILTADLCIGHAITAKEVDLTIIFHSEYEVIVNNEVKNEEDNELGKTYAFKPNLDAMGYDELIEHGEAVMRAISLRSYGEGYKQGKFDADMDATYMRPKKKTAQERRDEIVEQAKADIENFKYRTFYGELRYSYHGIVCNVEFVVNKEKRTVVALLKSVGEGAVKSKGIAKAAPDDCFNVHIGKAIALHRALGLEVPDEYLNAPQPTEVRVGDVVECGSLKDVRHVKVVADGEYIGTGLDKAVISSITVKHRLIRIRDDSRTEVGE